MANTQIDISANGTTTLKTAGKYCDRDIDIHVHVPSGTPSPTQFVNVLTHSSTEIRLNQTYNGTVRNGAMCVIVDLAGLGITTTQKIEFRMRGLVIDLSNTSIMRSVDKATWSSLKSMVPPAIDGHGDCLVTISSLNPTSFPYLLLTFRNSTAEVTMDTYSGAILTVNEPIGNGGYAG